MGVTLTICTTCKFAPDRPFDPLGRTGGRLLAEAVEAAAGNRAAPPDIVRQECLWACARSCAILIEGDGGTGYVAGGFEPNAAAADAILDWISAYAESDDGSVRYARWPAGMKGHFIARIPARGGDRK